MSHVGRPVVDRTGRVYGRLTVIKRAHDKGPEIYWECQCSCGNTACVRGHHLHAGQQSCGCLAREASRKATTKHGRYKSREYGIWAHILQRCYNPRCHAFENYGAQGLTVADRWRQFECFYADMGPAPLGHSIDRIDNALGYTPENCRWANHHEQNSNRRLSHWIEWRGKRLTVSQWSRTLQVSRNTVKHRWKCHQSLDPIPSSHWQRQPPTRQPSS